MKKHSYSQSHMKGQMHSASRCKNSMRVASNKIMVDNKQKQEKLHRFFVELKEQPSIRPFLDIGHISKLGVRDFVYITSKPPTLQKIEKTLRRRSYVYLCQFINDLTQIFVAVSDYCLSADPIQTVCDEFLCKIEQFENQFKEQFQYQSTNTKGQRSLEATTEGLSQAVLESNRQQNTAKTQLAQNYGSSSLLDKLKMLSLFRQNEDIQVGLRQWALANQIYDETENEIIIKINDRQGSWQQFMNKRYD